MGIDFGSSNIDGWTEEQTKLLSVIPHVTGSLSIFGSAFIIYDIASDRKKWSSTYHRLLFAMGFVDFFSSCATTLSTIPMPAESGDLSYGNDATCALQGFFVHFNIASPLYNLMLSIYFLLTVTFGWKKSDIKAKVEIWLHGIPLAWSFITAVVVLAQKGFNDSSLWCWINSYPMPCSGDDCERCPQCGSYRFWFFYGPLWFAAVGTIVVMGILVSSVRKTEKKAAKWRPERVQKKMEKRATQLSAREFSNQSFNSKEAAPNGERDSSNPSRSVDLGDDKEDSSKGERDSSNRNRSVLDSGVEKEGASKSANGSSNRSLSMMRSVRDFRPSLPSHLHGIKVRGWRGSRITIADIEERRERKKALRMTRVVTGQALRYCAVFWITWIFGSTNRILQFATGGESYFWIMFFHVIFTPLQGLLNCIVYVDLRVQKWWKKKKLARSKAKSIRKRERQSQENSSAASIPAGQAASFDTLDNLNGDLSDIDEGDL